MPHESPCGHLSGVDVPNPIIWIIIMSRDLFACVAFVLLATVTEFVIADDWPQWRGPKRDGVWRETGIVERFEQPQLPYLWRQPISSGYCGPTVAKGRVYVMDRQTQPKQIERVLCFNASDGAPIWQHTYPAVYAISYEAGPRASVTIYDDRAFALGAMGLLHCFDAATGNVRWKVDLQQAYEIKMPVWGIAAAPLIVDDLVVLHIGGKNATVVALDKATGEQRWTALSDRPSYSAPVLIEQAGRRVVACWNGDSVAGLNPESGDVYWRFPFPPSRMPIGVATPVVDGDRLFVSSFYDGSLLLRLHEDRMAVSKIWQRRGSNERSTDSLHCMISTPVIHGDYIYGVDSYGELRCLEASSGDRVWEDLGATPPGRWSNIHIVRNGDRYWMFNEAGELIIGTLSSRGFREISRTKLLQPTLDQLRRRGGVCWSHPAFANRRVFARNDMELVSASLAAE